MKACTGIGCELKKKCQRYREPTEQNKHDLFYLTFAPVRYQNGKAVCDDQIVTSESLNDFGCDQ